MYLTYERTDKTTGIKKQIKISETNLLREAHRLEIKCYGLTLSGILGKVLKEYQKANKNFKYLRI